MLQVKKKVNIEYITRQDIFAAKPILLYIKTLPLFSFLFTSKHHEDYFCNALKLNHNFHSGKLYEK
ncbi:hypothetical protein D0T56_09010 [Dysgonomonas sp. 520]|nr:hypothetical protein [Dysgonomonas sp. 520]